MGIDARIFYILAFFTILFISSISATNFIQVADAWKPKTHMYAAQQATELILQGQNIIILSNGEQYPIDSRIANAIRNYPQYYRGGVIGPDAFPDIYVGQGLIHPDLRCYDGTKSDPACKQPGQDGSFTHQWIRHIYESGWDYYLNSDSSPQNRQKVLAFTYGYITHTAGDTWGHTLVNEYAKGVFPAVADVKSNDAKAAIAMRHIVVEGYIGIFTPPTNMQHSSPSNFIYDTMIDNSKAKSLGRGTIFDFFFDLRSELDDIYDDAIAKQERLVEVTLEILECSAKMAVFACSPTTLASLTAEQTVLVTLQPIFLLEILIKQLEF